VALRCHGAAPWRGLPKYWADPDVLVVNGTHVALSSNKVFYKGASGSGRAVPRRCTVAGITEVWADPTVVNGSLLHQRVNTVRKGAVCTLTTREYETQL
jgi:hypothetical protein